MKVKFANGEVKECLAPTEQKIFKTGDGKTVGAGWILSLRLTGLITSAEIDEMLTADNVSQLSFFAGTDDENSVIFTINGYEKITSSTIRYAEETAATHTEIQLSKGV